jgi:transcriptional regulator with XRE-family HTH domain
MAHPSFAAKLAEMLEMIERALSAIEQGGGEPELRSLQRLLQEMLVNCMRLLERNPGIEAAAADLYASATALVVDHASSAQPLVRKLRLFREARLRFRHRLTTARPSEHGTNIMWRHHELLSA